MDSPDGGPSATSPPDPAHHPCDVSAQVEADGADDVAVNALSLAPRGPGLVPAGGERTAETDTGQTGAAEPEELRPHPPTIPGPDVDAIRAARALITNDPRLGQLGELVVWAAGAQSCRPPRAFTAPVALVVAGRHTAARYVAGTAEDEVDRRVEALRSGLSALAAPGTFAERASSVRVLDLAEVRSTAGPIGTADACTLAEALRAFAAGRAAVDREIDGGADLIVLGDVDADDGPSVAALVSVLTGREPVRCVRRGGDPGVWARTVEVVRDARRRGLPWRGDPLGLLAVIGGPDLAALTGALVQTAARRTPALLDGTAAGACGLLADRFAPDCSLWWAAASRTGDPAHDLALAALGLAPILQLGLRYDGAAAGLLALSLLQAALAATDR